jgi:hypothetical protein
MPAGQLASVPRLLGRTTPAERLHVRRYNLSSSFALIFFGSALLVLILSIVIVWFRRNFLG